MAAFVGELVQRDDVKAIIERAATGRRLRVIKRFQGHLLSGANACLQSGQPRCILIVILTKTKNLRRRQSARRLPRQEVVPLVRYRVTQQG